jgi:hypothetical protein
MRWVARAVGDEHTIKVMRNLVDRKVIWQDSDTSATSHKTPENILLDATVDNRHVHISILGTNVEWGLGTDFLDQVDLLWVNKCFILVGIIFLSDGDSSE